MHSSHRGHSPPPAGGGNSSSSASYFFRTNNRSGGKQNKKLPHGLTVQELKAMTHARLAAEAAAATPPSDGHSVPSPNVHAGPPHQQQQPLPYGDAYGMSNYHNVVQSPTPPPMEQHQFFNQQSGTATAPLSQPKQPQVQRRNWLTFGRTKSNAVNDGQGLNVAASIRQSNVTPELMGGAGYSPKPSYQDLWSIANSSVQTDHYQDTLEAYDTSSFYSGYSVESAPNSPVHQPPPPSYPRMTEDSLSSLENHGFPAARKAGNFAIPLETVNQATLMPMDMKIARRSTAESAQLPNWVAESVLNTPALNNEGRKTFMEKEDFTSLYAESDSQGLIDYSSIFRNDSFASEGRQLMASHQSLSFGGSSAGVIGSSSQNSTGETRPRLQSDGFLTRFQRMNVKDDPFESSVNDASFFSLPAPISEFHADDSKGAVEDFYVKSVEPFESN